MATQLTTLSVFPRGKPIKGLPENLAVPKGAPASEIYQQLAARSGFSIQRLRVTKASDGQAIPNDAEVPVLQTGLLEGSKIYIKDLGPQLGWRTVYVIEYIGPLLIHPLVFWLRPYLYASPDPSAPFPAPSTVQQLSLALVTLHYLKRELETLFLHTFTQATMPVWNAWRNSGHYWGLSGLLMAYAIYSPTAPAAGDIIPWLTYPGLAMYGAGELGNAYTHVVFARLRRADGEARGIPRGLAFDWVTSPNYSFELLAWLGVVLVTRSWATVVFAVVAVYYMAPWAAIRERRYRKLFGDKYKRKRYLMVPGIY